MGRETADLVKRLAGRRILVIGDMVADIYIDGRISRISREAPVLVLEQAGERIVAGGAANVAHNAQTLGGSVYAVGLLGEDAAAQGLADILAEKGVQNLFDLDEIVLDFRGNLTDQQFFLSLPRHFIEQGNFRTGLRRIAGDAGMDPRDGDIYLVGKISAQVLIISLRVLGQQNCRGNLHGQSFGMARTILGQPVGGCRNGLYQAAIIGMPELSNKV